MKKWVPFILLFSLIVGCVKKETPEPFIDDRAGLLTKENRERIGTYYQALLTELDIHFKVAILNESPADLDEAAAYLFEEYALGSQTRGKRGLLLVIDPIGNEIRMEVGYDLEPVFPDGFIGTVERAQMVPFFQAGDVGTGIEATGELLVARAMGVFGREDYFPEDVGAQAGDFSGGAGARTRAPIGSGLPEKTKHPESPTFGPQPEPFMALEKYVEVLQKKIKDSDLKLYTPETRQFLRGKVITDGQQNHELDRLMRVLPNSRVYQEGKRAVIRFPEEESMSPPYFFRKGESGWMLDFASMAHWIGFDFKNQWFFRKVNHDYMFAFKDIRFEKTEVEHPKTD